MFSPTVLATVFFVVLMGIPSVMSAPLRASVSKKKKVTTRTESTEVYPAREDFDAIETLSRDTAVDLQEPPTDVAPRVAASVAELDALAQQRALEEKLRLLDRQIRATPRPTQAAPTPPTTVTTRSSSQETMIASSSSSARPAETVAVRPATEFKPIAKNYFDVPADKTSTVMRRIQLVEYILKHYGRAYDYRTMTARQLEDVVLDLRKSERPAAARVILAE